MNWGHLGFTLEKGGALTGIKLPSDGDTANFRVAESQQEGPVGLVDEQVVGLLRIHETQNSPGSQRSKSRSRV